MYGTALMLMGWYSCVIRRPIYPTSRRTLLVNWRWIVKSNESTTLGRKRGSNASPAAADALLMPGKTGWGSVGVAAGIGAPRPSQPPEGGQPRKAAGTLGEARAC